MKKIQKTKEYKEDVPVYPMRINKYLANKQVATRRGVDKLIEKKKVFINGKLAVLGSKVNKDDIVEIKKNKNEEKIYMYYAYNKTKGVATEDIVSKVPFDTKTSGLFPIGRLDKNSHGLLILTNDGRITDGLLNPKYSHEKEYIVKTKEKLRSNFKEKMEKGVNIEGYITKSCKVEIINDFIFKVILTEGKKHQIRRMCSALFQEVEDLKRIRIMNIKLGDLKTNSSREIKGAELEEFLKPILVEKN
ncbi:MAG: pseudouridine synthase [Patescibacteria group bacterium]